MNPCLIISKKGVSRSFLIPGFVGLVSQLIKPTGLIIWNFKLFRLGLELGLIFFFRYKPTKPKPSSSFQAKPTSQAASLRQGVSSWVESMMS
jgi:hypothetical protein